MFNINIESLRLRTNRVTQINPELLITLDSVKSQICIYCEEMRDTMIMKLSCKCCICSYSCVQNCLDLIKTKKYTTCICSMSLYPTDIIKLSKNNKGYIKLNDLIKKSLKEAMLNSCMFCDAINLSIHNESHVGYVLQFTDEILSDKSGINIDIYKKFYHYCCRVCYSDQNKKGLCIEKSINCYNCGSSCHLLKGISLSSNANMKKINEENCAIF